MARLATSLISVLSLALLVAVGAAGSTPISLDQLKNLAYGGVYEAPVRLTDGSYEGKPFQAGAASRPRLRLVEALYLVTDLDDDGDEEAVVLLVEDSGGSGVNTYMAVVARREEGWRNIATVRIGDRVQVEALRKGRNGVVLDLVVAGPDDPMCCPVTKETRFYRFWDGALSEPVSEDAGRLSLRDLEGVSWTLAYLDRQQPAPDEPVITAGFAGGTVAGTAGCNRYSAALVSESPPEIVVGAVAATRMMCAQTVMDAEGDYLRRLEKAHRFSFSYGRLALDYEVEGTSGTLIFNRR